MSLDRFEFEVAGGSYALLRIEGIARSPRLGDPKLIVTDGATRRCFPALPRPAAPAARKGAFDAGFAVPNALLDDATSYTLVLGPGASIELPAPQPRRRTRPTIARGSDPRLYRVSDRFLRISLAALVVTGLLAAAMIGPLLAEEPADPGGPRKLGSAELRPVPGDLPTVVVDVGQRARAQVSILEEHRPDRFRELLTRRAGEVGPGLAEIRLGSGHATDGGSPGKVLDTSDLLRFSVERGDRGGLPPGDYAATVQLRSRR